MTAPGLYMLDTNICSFLMRRQPAGLLDRVAQAAADGHTLVVSAITYAEMRFGAIGRKASPRHVRLVDEFVRRLDGVLAWDAAAVDEIVRVRQELAAVGRPISDNDSAIAAHARYVGAVLVTNNLREFGRVADLTVEDWSTDASQ
ncbi:MAG: type II toxin-antitoxin system VapC family toxin [Micrococcales bacterium]|nr:type II toxin-antitoxin system VapC family toxin [Micrococcales bacterium]